MSLAPNSRLGPYVIKNALGTGGMGEVYRASDSRLNRDVALKVLRSDATATADLKLRFEREARAIAALNHPNIVAIFDFGTDTAPQNGSAQYIVSELIEGESLRTVIAGKPLPVRKLIDIAVQVVDGLSAAHAAGIVHRDLKPENIMLAKDGRVKILDFGLAHRKVRPLAGNPEETLVPADDAKQSLTSAGAILGTANYMSPEQAVGKETDYRSDQFSFGLVLHEMASGKQAFARGSSVETMAAIVRDEVPPIEEKLPAPLKWIIDRCLNKEPQQRYDSTRDLYQELRNLREHFSEAFSSSGSMVAVPAKARRGTSRLGAGVALASAGMLGLLLFLLLIRPAGQRIGEYEYTPFASDANGPIWSPDGKAVAYNGEVDGHQQVFLRYLNAPVATQLTHDRTSSFVLGWSSDRTHLLVAQWPDRINMKVSTMAIFGGDLESVLEMPLHDDGAYFGLSPDGKTLAILSRGEDSAFHLSLSSPVGAPLREYLPAPFASTHLFGFPQVAFSPDGRKIFLSRSGDLDRPEMWLLPYPVGSGQPRKIFSALMAGYTPHVAWMPDSRHVVLSINLKLEPDHLWMADTESGALEPLSHGAHIERDPALSPDGKTLIYAEHSKQFDLASISVDDGTVHTLATGGHVEHKPAWAAHQAKLTWVSERSGLPEIWVRNSDGSERPAVTTKDFADGRAGLFENPSLSPEGDRLIYGMIDVDGVGHLWISSLAGGSPARVTNGSREATEYSGDWSPDGKRYVYQQQLHGKSDLMLVRTNGNATPVALKRLSDELFLSAWSPTGEWITFKDENGEALLSPDGRTEKRLGKLDTEALGFSKDGKKLYGIHSVDGHVQLFSVDSATGKVTVIKGLGDEWEPDDDLFPAIRYSMAPDGKSFVYAVSKTRNDLWMLQGFRQPDWTDRLRSAFSR
jgi:eukaryotic-like serine/threonine-protein kinase